MTHTALDPAFDALIDRYAPVGQVGTGFVFTEGPIWNPVEGALLFSDMPGDVRRRWTRERGVEEILRPSHMANGLTYDANLNLLACEHATSSVTRVDRATGERAVLCSHHQGRELNSPNDIVVKSDGAIYFTDPTYGRMAHFGVPRPTEQGFQGVYMLRPGHRPGDEATLVCDRSTFSQPNGLTFSPCERWMWVNDTEQANIRMFDVAPDGRLTNGRVFASGIRDALLPGKPDGMKADREGNVWVTAPGGMWVYSFHGALIGKVAAPEMVANLHWGGDDWGTLFLCATTSVYSVPTKARPRIEPFMGVKAQAGGAAPAQTAATPPPSAAPARMSSALRLDPKRTALILQDMQNDVIVEGGAFAGSGSPAHAREQGVIANAARLADACRRAGVTVIHVHFLCEPGHPLLGHNAPLFEGVRAENALVRGTWGAAPAAGIEPHAGDLVVEKMSMSAWETSRLDSYLRMGGIDTILNCGAWTNMSVEHTARTGADRGYRIVLPEDACSTMNADWHRASIDYAMTNVAEVTKVDAVIAALG